MAFEEQLKKFMHDRFANAIVREDNFRDQLSFYIKPESLLDICRAFLEEDELDLKYLKDICSVDWYGHADEVAEGRFEVIYNFYSIKHKFRFFLKVRLSEDNPVIDSVTPLFNGANWMEREVWDLFGIEFTGHPELTKILTPDDLEGHPLRRDFPLTWEQPRFSWNKDDPPEVIK